MSSRRCAPQMKKDGLIPIAFADKDGWPAMGTFDYLNMRINGYQFHVDLCAHKESWDQQKVKDVFDNWKAMLPYQDPAALGRDLAGGGPTLGKKKAGMYLLGSFVTQQFTDKAVLADIDFFPFPEHRPIKGLDAVEAPIDGFMLSKKGGDNQARRGPAGLHRHRRRARTPTPRSTTTTCRPTRGATRPSSPPLQKKAPR